MLRRCLSITLAGLLIGTFGTRPAYAGSGEHKQSRFTEKVKEGIAKLGTGPDAHVKIELRDKTKLKGFIREASDEHFIVVDPNNAEATKVAFSDVHQIKGNNLSKGEKIAITLAAVGVIAILMIVGAPRT